jgi:RNA polymerase sigma factor (sigma-70 family)
MIYWAWTFQLPLSFANMAWGPPPVCRTLTTKCCRACVLTIRRSSALSTTSTSPKFSGTCVIVSTIPTPYRRPTEALPEDIVDGALAPTDEYERREQNRHFQAAYGRLTAEQQHVLALRFGQGYSLEETASVMKKNVNAVKALQVRALGALQRSLGASSPRSGAPREGDE